VLAAVIIVAGAGAGAAEPARAEPLAPVASSVAGITLAHGGWSFGFGYYPPTYGFRFGLYPPRHGYGYSYYPPRYGHGYGYGYPPGPPVYRYYGAPYRHFYGDRYRGGSYRGLPGWDDYHRAPGYHAYGYR